MLKRTPSLALRAGLVFMSVYAAIFLAVIALNAVASWLDRGEGNQRGPVLAIEYAAEELRQANGGLQLPGQGGFARLAAKNPSMWLIVVKDGRYFSTGAVPKAALETAAHFQGAMNIVLVRMPGIEMPQATAALERRDLTFGPVLMAAGGVDPATLSTAESIHLLLEPEVVGMLGVIAVISLLGMLVAIPVFARALGPITTEAGAISPQDPGRRLRQGKVPKELLPLVGGFNAALDRLEVELGRRKRFIADVAHELRTPLATLTLRVEALVDEEARRDLTRGTRRLTHLVSQMLDLERLSLSGERRCRVDLVEAATEVVEDLAPMAISRGYDLSLAAPDSPVIVRGDPHAIARAITNLVGNAVVHGGCAGQISVTVGEDRTIDVRDEGQGVPAALQPRLFEPFARADQNAEGCGLGLHLTREIMRAHGGEVCLVPSEGGATFRLLFPPEGGS